MVEELRRPGTTFDALDPVGQGEFLRAVGFGLTIAPDKERALRGVPISEWADRVLAAAIEVAPNNSLGYKHRYELLRAEDDLSAAMDVIREFFERNPEVTRDSSLKPFLNDWGAMLSQRSGVSDWYQDRAVREINEDAVEEWGQIGPLLASYSPRFVTGDSDRDQSLKDLLTRWEKVSRLHA